MDIKICENDAENQRREMQERQKERRWSVIRQGPGANKIMRRRNGGGPKRMALGADKPATPRCGSEADRAGARYVHDAT
jgi:hypothetical protein